MKKIVKWLGSLKPESINESATTSSVYYVVEGLKIRLADHFTPHQKSCDLQIICPINNPSTYIVTIKEGLQVLGFRSISELAHFIETYALINRIKKTSDEMKADKIEDDYRQVDRNSIVNNKQRASKEFWKTTCEFLALDCPKFESLSNTQKKACRQLLQTTIPYKRCVDLINVITNSKNCSTSTMNKFFQPYIVKHIK